MVGRFFAMPCPGHPSFAWGCMAGPHWGKLSLPAPRQLKVPPRIKQFLLHSPWRWLLLPLLVSPLLVLVFWGGQQVLSPEAHNRFSFSRPGDLVLLGIDPIGANADVVVAVRTQGGQIQITQIPRDTFTHSEARGYWKIGELYGLAGAEAVQEQVAALLGADFPYLVVAHGGVLAAVVDALGGLTVTVPTRMVYSDRTQDLRIDLEPGRQLLNGRQVEHFIRWRGFDGDIGRLERRQEVVNALEEVFQNPGIWARLPRLKQVLEDEVRAGRLLTNLDLKALPAFAKGFATGGATIEVLPGHEGYYREKSYWFAEEGALPPDAAAPHQQEAEDTWQREMGLPAPALPQIPPDPSPQDVPSPPAIPPPPIGQGDRQSGEP